MKLLDIAEKEIGTTEVPLNSNKTKYGKWFGLDGLPWCGIFVSWVFHKAGRPLPKIGFEKGFASCQLALSYFTKKGMVVTEPLPGDLVFYDFNLDNRYDHVGIVYQVLHGFNSIEAIEGNTSFTNERNGGTVMKRVRDITLATVFVRVTN